MKYYHRNDCIKIEYSSLLTCHTTATDDSIDPLVNNDLERAGRGEGEAEGGSGLEISYLRGSSIKLSALGVVYPLLGSFLRPLFRATTRRPQQTISELLV